MGVHLGGQNHIPFRSPHTKKNKMSIHELNSVLKCFVNYHGQKNLVSFLFIKVKKFLLVLLK